MNDERITELEIKMTYLEDSLSALSDEFIRQKKLIDRLNREIEKLRDEAMTPEIRGNEKPPHY